MGKSHQYPNHGGGGRGGRWNSSDNHNNDNQSYNSRNDQWPRYRSPSQWGSPPPQDTWRQPPYNQNPQSPRFPVSTTSDSRARTDSHSQSGQQELHRTTQPHRSTSRQPEKDEPEKTQQEEQEHLANSIAYDTEWKQRKTTLEELLSLPTVEKRKERLNGLSYKQNLMLFFPQGVSMESLSPCQEPPHFPDKVEKALDKCLKLIPELFGSEQMDEDDFDPCDEMYAPPPDEGAEEARQFVRGLPFCQPFLAGFHVMSILAVAGENVMCYCPCGRHMSPWQRCFLADSMIEEHRSLKSLKSASPFHCTFKGPKAPYELYKHITTLADNGCRYHKLLQTFLLESMQDYHQPRMRHMELENKEDYRHREARAFLMKEIKRKGDKEAEELRQVLKKLQEMKVYQTKLEKTNKDLAKRLKATQALKDRLKATAEEDYQPDQIQMAIAELESVKESTRRALYDACSKSDDVGVFLEIEQKIEIQALFDDFYSQFVKSKKSDFSFFFDSLRNPTQSEARLQVVKKWTIIFKACENEATMREIEEAIEEEDIAESDSEDDMQPIVEPDAGHDKVGTTGQGVDGQKDQKLQLSRPKDEGGPTRFFFSKIWDELVLLKVRLPGKKIPLALFALKEAGLLPEEDDVIFQFFKPPMPPQNVESHRGGSQKRSSSSDSPPETNSSKSLNALTQVEKEKKILDDLKGSDAAKLLSKGEKEKIFECLKGCENIDDARLRLDEFLRVKAYYIMFGRLLAHAMLLDPSDGDTKGKDSNDKGSIPIGKKVLPDLLKNVLLRKLDVTNEAYRLADIIDHMRGIVPIESEAESGKEYEEALRQKIKELDSGKELREVVHEYYIEPRAQALAWIDEGLSIGGRVLWWPFLRSVPTKSLTRLLNFCEQQIPPASAFDEKGNFRFIKFTVHSDGFSQFFTAKQDLFKKRLVIWFKKKMRKDSMFMTHFVYFCTASKYIPDLELYPTWHIIVEFNYSEMVAHDNNFNAEDEVDLINAFLPVVHTCCNTIKIPAHAYDAKMKVFGKKLAASMAQTMETFDMA